MSAFYEEMLCWRQEAGHEHFSERVDTGLTVWRRWRLCLRLTILVVVCGVLSTATTQAAPAVQEACVVSASNDACPTWVQRYGLTAAESEASPGVHLRDIAESFDATLSPDEATLFVVGRSLDLVNQTSVDTDPVLNSSLYKSDAVVIAYDADSGAPLWSAVSAQARIEEWRTVAVSPAGNRLFVSGWTSLPNDEMSFLTAAYDTADGRLLWSAEHRASDGLAYGREIAVSGDGRRVYVAGTDSVGTRRSFGTLAYDAADGHELWHAQAATAFCPNATSAPLAYPDAIAVAHTPDGEVVAVAGQIAHACGPAYDGITIAYDGVSGAQRWLARESLRGGVTIAQAVASPDGRRLAVTGSVNQGDALFQPKTMDELTVVYDSATGARMWRRVEPSDAPGASSRSAHDVVLDATRGVTYTAAVESGVSDACRGGSAVGGAYSGRYVVTARDTQTGAELWESSVAATSVTGGCLPPEPAPKLVMGGPDRLFLVAARALTARAESSGIGTATLSRATGAVQSQAVFADRAAGVVVARAASATSNGSRLFVTGTGTPVAHGERHGHWLTLSYDTAEQRPAALAAAPTAAMTSALDRLDGVVDISSSSLAAAVAATSQIGEVAVAAPSQAPAAVPSEVPLPLAPAVAAVLGAVDRAETTSLAALRNADRAAALQRKTQVLLASDSLRRPRFDRAGLAAFRRLQRLRADLDEAVDLGAISSAAYDVAAAIDRALPVLRAHRGLAGRHGDPGPGCDVYEDFPRLCIAGDADNVHARDFSLLIDLGGDDTYSNSAGGASALNPDGYEGALPVSVVIDVTGNDLYEAPAGAKEHGAFQGAAYYGGVGVLVDATGDDRYLAESDAGQLLGQGFGVEGAGVLADLGQGDDTFAMSVSDIDDNRGHYCHSHVVEGEFNVCARGHGVAESGFALSLQGGGNDTYLLSTAMPPTGVAGQPLRIRLDSNVYGFGFGILGGTAAFVDAGGRDEQVLEAVTLPLGPGDQRRADRRGQNDSPWVNTQTIGFGYGIAGTGVAANLDGDTVWRTHVSGESPEQDLLFAQGMGVGAIGFGGLYDGSGNDEYEVMVVADASVDAAQRSEGGAGVAQVNLARFQGLGVGVIGTGVVHDIAGNDIYRSEVRASVRMNGRSQTATVRPALTISQSHGYSPGAFDVPSLGLLQDDAGNDRYDIVDDSTAFAVTEGEPPTESSIAIERSADSIGLGLGVGVTMSEAFGVLRDLSGADSYRAISTATVDSAPTTDTEFATQTYTGALGSGDDIGHGIFTDAGDGVGLNDTFVVVPKNAACFGARGSSYWRDCGAGGSFGTNT